MKALTGFQLFAITSNAKRQVISVNANFANTTHM
jgi:hypothetical protein